MSRLLTRSSFGGEVSAVRGNTLVLGTGAPRAIVATSSLNFAGLAPEQQRAAELGFRDLINGQSGPIQLYLRIRRRLGGLPDEPVQAAYSSQRDYLAALTRSFVNTHLDETPVFERTAFLVLGSFDSGRPLLRSWRFHFDRSRSDPVSVATDAGQSLATRATTLVEQLRRIGIKGQLLQDDALERLLTELYRSGGDGGALHPSFIQRRDGVEIGGRPYASFVVDRYPGEEIESGWLLPLLSFRGELHIGIHIIPLDTDRMIRLLQHRIRDLRADEMVDMESGAVGRASLGTLPDALSMHQSLARNEEKVFAVSFYLTVGADDPMQLQTSVEALRTTCRRMMLHTVSPYFEMRQALLSSWPFGTDLLGREQILQTSAVLTMFPWLQDDLDEGDGHYWGYNKDTGGLCVFDPFDEGRFPNANIAVMAHSGAGKTYAAASVVLSGFTRDVGAIVLDPEAEYGGLVRSLGGTYVHLATGSGHAINVLDPLVCAANADEPSDQLSDVLDFIGLICGHLDEVERAQVEMVIRRVVAEESSPVLADVWQRLERAEHASRISTILARWVSGDLGRLFSSPTNLDLASPVVGFNLRDMSEELIGPAYLVLANWLWLMLRRDPRPRHLLIDEAGLLLEHEPIRRFLIRLARRIRKYRGSLILVSQNPGDFFDTKDGAVLATNPSILLLGSQKHSEALKLQKAYSLTERQVNYLETAQRGDFLLVGGPNRVPVHIMAPPWMDEMIVASRSH